ncbi:hypothetical protein [Paenibacillus xylaniclasticus]|uniref:hypothetical protein n=1 Tax=Paenibacillus xylaniclasticus TaxID=588083 RepID=UPI000FD6CC36|nr:MULTISPECIES: hypothetical protein [Paenibacillus]GFN30610.1 hypothetical protein PCURB6_08700 [Paenibacillus curdlanolyticus]
MDKRLSRTEMLVSLGFLFMLVCTVGAFFFGVRVGSDRATANYEVQKELNSKSETATTLQQQDLVSFYHTVFMPYREFQSEWIKVIEQANAKSTTDFPADLKRMASLAQQQYNEISAIKLPASTKLAQSQQQILKSLTEFQNESKKLINSSSGKSVAQLLTAMRKDTLYKQAVGHSLNSQQSYYDAMLKWAAGMDSDIPSEIVMSQDMKTTAWSKLPLVAKNKLSADLIAANGKLVNYYPQDLSSRIDEFIESGQAGKLKLVLVRPISELLTDTKAVRNGDYKSNMSQFYSNQVLPQLPFFLPGE